MSQRKARLARTGCMPAHADRDRRRATAGVARRGLNDPRRRRRLAGRQFDPAFADDRVVTLLEAADELVAMGEARRSFDLGTRRVRPGETDVVGDRAVEEEVVLEDDAEPVAVLAELEPRQVAAVD